MGSYMIPELVAAYAILITISGCGYIAFILAGVCWIALQIFRIKPASAEAVSLIYDHSRPIVIAHRGAGFDAPENTIAAIRQAKKNGATAVEFDVEYTLDGIAVVFHDDTLERCTDGTGNIREKTFDHIRQLNASANDRNKTAFPNQRIPTLEEMIQECLENDLLMFIDVKSNVAKHCTATEGYVSKADVPTMQTISKMILFQSHGLDLHSVEILTGLFKRFSKLYKKAIVCSFNPRIIYAVRKADPNIVGGLTHRSHYLTRKVDKTEKNGPLYKQLIFPYVDMLLQWSHYAWLWYLCGNSFFLANLGDVSSSTVEHFRKRGVETVVWTVNNPIDRNYFLKSIGCSIISDTMDGNTCVPAQAH